MNINRIQSPIQTINSTPRRLPNAAGSEGIKTFEQAQADVKRIGKQSQGPTVNDDPNEIVSENEKDFFVQMFPESENEIRSYNSYQSDGTRSTVKLGTMIDRKG
jgi:hypothetical protein